MALDPAPRAVVRMERMVGDELRRGETVQQALPVWIGGTYVPFLGTIVVAAALSAGMASAIGLNGLIVTGLGAAIGAVVGRALAKRGARDHPFEADALQVYIGVTRQRVLIYEPQSLGKPGRLLDSFPLGRVGSVEFVKGNFLRPSRLLFFAPDGEHVYEFPGLWNPEGLLHALQ